MAILSIQSSVAYGHVGNSAATFPLQRLGHEVWPVITVHFSNHTGYGAWKGPILAASDVADVIDGIEQRGVFPDCRAVLSGYMGDPSIGAIILDAVARVRSANPEALYCCDPVMGDVGRGFFVRAGIPEFMRDHAVPAADLVTPNQFELEFLTATTIKTLPEAIAAARQLLRQGPRLVVVTSLSREDGPDGAIEMLAVTADAAWLIETPLLPISVNGAGDTVAALLLAHYLELRDVAAALARTAATIFAILDETHRSGRREIQLIAAQDRIAAPDLRFQARAVDTGS